MGAAPWAASLLVLEKTSSSLPRKFIRNQLYGGISLQTSYSSLLQSFYGRPPIPTPLCQPEELVSLVSEVASASWEFLLGLGHLLADWGCSSQVPWLENAPSAQRMGSELRLFPKPHWGYAWPSWEGSTAPGLTMEKWGGGLVLPGPLCG